MYSIYFDDILLPVTPAKLELSIKNHNKTINLINEGEINLLKLPGLTEISFDMRIPQQQNYPFARDLKPAEFYLTKLKQYKLEKKPIRFKCVRVTPDNKVLFNNDLLVSLEDYKITESAADGLDLTIPIKLKEYREFATQTANITPAAVAGEPATLTVVQTRAPGDEPAESTHTVESGDCLWNIAKLHLGDGSRYQEIYELNKDKIQNPNLIYPGQVLVLP